MPDPDPYLAMRHSRAIFDLALRLPCKRHAVKPGEGCWTLNDLPALCARRFSALPKRQAKR